MARKRAFLDEVATTPWWFGLLTGAVGGGVILLAGPFILSNVPGPVGQIMGSAFTPLVVPGAIAFFLLCALAAGRSWIAARHRARLLRTHSQLDQLRVMSWQDFERLVGEIFRNEGYRVTESGLGGADGGVDLVLERGGQRTLVQCKRWTKRSVGVAIVRELAGVLAHDEAATAILVTTSTYTLEAKTFAANKPISLIDGEELLSRITRCNTSETPKLPDSANTRAEPLAALTPRAPALEPKQSTAAPMTSATRAERAAAPAAPRREQDPKTVSSSMDDPSLPAPDRTVPGEAQACPRCGSLMVSRTNKSSGAAFWGCSAFPRCRGTLPVS